MNKNEVLISLTVVVCAFSLSVFLLPKFIKHQYNLSLRYKLDGSSSQIDSIQVSFQSHSAVLSLSGGSMQTTNSTLVNGDLVEKTTFVPNGQIFNQRIGDPSFTQIFGSLMTSNPPALNMDAVTNATIGQTGVSIAGFDTTTFDVTTNQELD